MKSLIYVFLNFFVFASVSWGYQTPKDLIINEECKTFLESIQNKYEIRWLKTLETPQSKNSIYVLYYYQRNSALKNPVIFFNGGPGFSSHSSVGRLEQAQEKFMTQNIDFIFMDQRGTGCSSSYPLGIQKESLDKLQHYGSAGIVQDAELIRKELLGDRKWKVFGQSYGSFIVHRYIKMYPSSILKAYGHGYPVGATDFDLNYTRIASQYKIVQSYLQKYPMDQIRLKVINLHLSDSKKCYKNLQLEEYCGFEVLTPLLNYIGFRDSWELIHALLLSMAPGHYVDEEGLQNYINAHAIRTEVVHISEIQNPENLQYQSIALNFFGVIDRESRPLDEPICQLIYDKMKSTLKIDEEDILLDQCRAPTQFKYVDQLFGILKSKTQSPIDFIQIEDIKKNVIQFKFPFYLYSGELDCYVPKSLFEKEVKALGSFVKYTHFMKSGHDGYTTEKQIFLDLTN